ncbi:MAG: DarT ssDNA thymidine ADP-ribosyltransferase family protein [Lacisediminihabitans sp.]
MFLSEQRLHHLTHIDNLTGILVDGVLHADAAQSWTGRPDIDISSSDTREARRTTSIAGTETTVANYVPFFLSPDANLWEGMRMGTPDPRLTRIARSTPASEFIMLVTTIKQVTAIGAHYPLVTDGDAADPRTRFATTQEDAERALRRMLASDDGAVLRAEMLVPDPVPFDIITLIGVANDKVRAATRSLLAGSGYQPRVAVHPPWFALPTDG